jgi:hypothetical protein
VISLSKGIIGIFNFAVAGLILPELLIYALKNAQTYNGTKSLAKMLLSTIGFSQIVGEYRYSLNTRMKNPKKNNKLAIRLKGLRLKVVKCKYDQKQSDWIYRVFR